MVLYSEFRDVQIGRNFLIREALCNEAHKLLLPEGQPGLARNNMPVTIPFRSGFLCHGMEDRHAQIRRTTRVSLRDIPDARDKLSSRGVLQNVAICPGTDRGEEVIGTVFHPE